MAKCHMSNVGMSARWSRNRKCWSKDSSSASVGLRWRRVWMNCTNLGPLSVSASASPNWVSFQALERLFLVASPLRKRAEDLPILFDDRQRARVLPQFPPAPGRQPHDPRLGADRRGQRLCYLGWRRTPFRMLESRTSNTTVGCLRLRVDRAHVAESFASISRRSAGERRFHFTSETTRVGCW
jgi:hypothetical protein